MTCSVFKGKHHAKQFFLSQHCSPFIVIYYLMRHLATQEVSSPITRLTVNEQDFSSYRVHISVADQKMTLLQMVIQGETQFPCPPL